TQQPSPTLRMRAFRGIFARFEDIDTPTSLFREVLALRPQCHPDHPLSLYNLTE
ncbi:uncharacterized protein BJ212DRAFT_1397108, partial [Suillus subaureus]